MTKDLRAEFASLFPHESDSQLYAHIERLRLAEIERERVEREDRAREARCRRESIEYTARSE